MIASSAEWPIASSNGAQSATEAKNGPGALTYPVCSTNTHRSVASPVPSAANSRRWFQSGSTAVRSVMWARRSEGGHSLPSNARAVSRSNSWSGVNEKSMPLLSR